MTEKERLLWQLIKASTEMREQILVMQYGPNDQPRAGVRDNDRGIALGLAARAFDKAYDEWLGSFEEKP